MSSLWIDKYKPQSIDELVNNDENIEKIRKWLKIFINNKKGKYKDFSNGLFIYGDLSIGKKSCIKLLLEEFDYQIKYIEFSTSLTIKNQFDSVDFLSMNKIFNNKKKIGICVSNVDYIISSTKSSVKFLTDYVCKSELNKSPVIFIASSIDSSNKNLAKECITISFNKPNDNNIEEFIIRISEKEGINFSLPVPKAIIDACQQDYRRTLYILENIKLYYKNKVLTENDYKNVINTFLKKDLTLDLNNAFELLIKKKNVSMDKALNAYSQNIIKLPFLIHENIVRNIKTNTTGASKDKLSKIYNYYEYLCDAYKIQTKILTNHTWELCDYVGILSCYSANLLLNTDTSKKKRPTTTVVSPIFSKINYKFYNLKFVNDICKRLNLSIQNFQNFTYKIYNLYVLTKIFTDEATEYKAYLKSKNFYFIDLDKSVKLSYLYDDYRALWVQQKRKVEKFFR
uniref:ATPase AAA-type core domain-containing protein n=1 Tax=viral metagenome TaxID=1070528 RepID=A0A6C0EIN6_9ZZZZ